MTAPPAGLRERKKAKTRAAIREHAMRLFEQQGYAETTVDQIAEAAEVSPSTFFRYFPAKEDVILVDDLDAVMVEAIRAQPAGVPPIEAVLRGVRALLADMEPADWERERRRQRLLAGVPELRSRMMQQMSDAIDLVAGTVADRTGRPAGDFAVRVLAGAVVGSMLSVLPPAGSAGGVVDGSAGGEPPWPADYQQVVRALELLRDGLPLD